MATQVVIAQEEGFQAPGAGAFELPPIVAGITKPMVLLVLAAVIVFVFYYGAMRRPALVPGRFQFLGEQAYNLVRDNVARDMIGSADFKRYVPYLVTLFSFILVNNVFGIVPLLQFPTMSRIGFPMALAALSWIIYNYVGLRRHGFIGYLRVQTWPPGIPGWVRIILTPLEFLSNIIVRPITLCLRLFGNMFAGHLLLMLFALGGEYLLLHADSLLYRPVGVLSFAMGIALSFFELLVMVLQAYIFAILTANYIGTALAEEH